MKIHDNRHLDSSNIVELGDLVITESDHYYMFTSISGCETYDVAQIDLRTFETVDMFPKAAFYKLRVGEAMVVGGIIKEIVKSKNLVLEMRK